MTVRKFVFVALILMQVMAGSMAYAFFWETDIEDAKKALSVGEVEEAINILKELSDEDNADAQYMLGWIYEYGHVYGIDIDHEEALKWFLLSSGNGNTDANNMAGFILRFFLKSPENLVQAFNLYKEASEAGNHSAWINYAEMLKDGEGGAQNLPLAVKYYEMSRGAGSSTASFKLAELYAKGAGVMQDLQKAADLYQEAIDETTPQAAWLLGQIYEKGEIDGKGEDEALSAYEKGAALGDMDSMRAAGRIHLARGKSIEKALLYLASSIAPQNMGRTISDMWIGMADKDDQVSELIALFEGDSETERLQDALQFSLLHAEQGVSAGQLLYGRLLGRSSDAPIDAARAMMWIVLGYEGLDQKAYRELRNDIEERLSFPGVNPSVFDGVRECKELNYLDCAKLFKAS